MLEESLAIVNCISYHIHCFLLIYFLPPLLHLLFMRSKSKSGQLSSSSSKTNNILEKSLRMANTKSGQIPLHISACQNKFLYTFHKFLQLLFLNWNFANCELYIQTHVNEFQYPFSLFLLQKRRQRKRLASVQFPSLNCRTPHFSNFMTSP